jgi:hypothetical protein
MAEKSGNGDKTTEKLNIQRLSKQQFQVKKA